MELGPVELGPMTRVGDGFKAPNNLGLGSGPTLGPVWPGPISSLAETHTEILNHYWNLQNVSRNMTVFYLLWFKKKM